MKALSIIKNFYPLKNTLLRFLSSFVIFKRGMFSLQSPEETIYSIVPAISFSTHAALNSIEFQKILISMTCILASSIRMNEKRCVLTAVSHTFDKGLFYKFFGHSLAHVPTHNFPRVENPSQQQDITILPLSKDM